MLSKSNDNTQRIMKKKKGFIETSQNWGPPQHHPLGKRRTEDEVFAYAVLFYHGVFSKRMTNGKWTGSKRMVEEARRVKKSGWKSIWRGMVTKHPINAWRQATRSTWSLNQLLQQNASMCCEWWLWWSAKRHTCGCGWQTHGSNHKCHSSPSTTSHAPLAMPAHITLCNAQTPWCTPTWLHGGWESGWPHCVDHHTIHSSQPHTSPLSLRSLTPSFNPSLLSSSCFNV